MPSTARIARAPWRRVLGVLALAALGSCWCGEVPPEAEVRAPPGVPASRGEGLVLLVLDTLRADHLGSYGQARPTSPHLDELAARGVRFARAYSTSSWTRAAMASLVSGRFARSVGVYEEALDVLPADVTTLAERLTAEGWLSLGVTANPNVNAFFGFDQGFAAYADSEVVFRFMPVEGGERRFRRADGLDDGAATTARALALVDAYASTLEDRPLFLQVLYVDPHYPYEPPGWALKAVGGGREVASRYAGEVRAVDAAVGALLEGLAERGLLEDTWVVVTSDHGEGLGDHPALPKAATHGHTLYTSQLHVPLIVWHPSLPGGRVVESLASTVDLAPTLLELLGVRPPADLPGRSLVRALREDAPGPRQVFAETEWRYTSKVAVVTAEHLLVRNDDARAWQLEGSHEQHELSSVEAFMLDRARPVELYAIGQRPMVPTASLEDPEVSGELLGALEAWEASTLARPPENRDPGDVWVLGDGTVVPVGEGTLRSLDAATAQQLRALGYLDAEE